MLRKSPLLPLLAFIAFLSFPSCKQYYMQHPPTVDAGPSDTITLPLDSARLTGTASAPNGSISSYSWSQLSGPSAATIAHADSAATWVKALIAGTYTFKLTVTDNEGVTASDTTNVVVNASLIHTLILQPENNPYEWTASKYGGHAYPGNDSNAITTESFYEIVDSINGQFWVARGVVKFAGLDSIPSTATILSANLYLYSNPTPGPLGAGGTRANVGILDYLTIYGPEHPTSFGTPYESIDVGGGGVINVDTTSKPFLDLNLDVTGLVSFSVNRRMNYGFVIQGVEGPSVVPNGRIFVSSHNPAYPDKHPKLVVQYK